MQRNSEKTHAEDIFQLLLEASRKQKKLERTQLLQSIGVKEFFEDGSIKIDEKTCRGVECKLCIKACPTNALYWRLGEVGITENLCVYCGACVLSCIVDDCIQVRRKRQNEKIEMFGKPVEVMALFNNINSKKRFERLTSVFPTLEAYLNRYHK